MDKFYRLDPDGIYVSWIQTMPQTLPHMQLWANSCGQQTGTGAAVSPREPIPLPETQVLCPPLLMRGHHFPIEGSPPSLNLKAIWIFSPTSMRYIYAHIYWQKKIHAHSWMWNVSFSPPYTKLWLKFGCKLYAQEAHFEKKLRIVNDDRPAAKQLTVWNSTSTKTQGSVLGMKACNQVTCLPKLDTRHTLAAENTSLAVIHFHANKSMINKDD